MAVVALIVASGAGWEPRALTLLDGHPGIVVLKRCVDVDDLLAAAASGQADAAVVAVDAPGLDARAVDHLRHHGVRPVAIVPGGRHGDAARLRAGRVGLHRLVADDDLDALPDALTEADDLPDPYLRGAAGPAPAGTPTGTLPGVARFPGPTTPPPGTPPFTPASATPPFTPASATPPAPPGRVIAVWGPGGAPGRTTVAAGVAAELARRSLATLRVDADPYGGAVAQQLGVLDEVSGLLSAARLATAGELAARFATVPRVLGPQLAVVTGLPRADRWVEVRPGALDELLLLARARGHAVVDTGFSLEDEPALDLGPRPPRNHLTLAALDAADEVLVVGTADPVGLTRLARGLVDLADRLPDVPLHVVVNRMRPTLGWGEREIAGMVAGVAEPAGLHFLPEDRPCVDRALVAGRTLVEPSPEAPLPRALAALVDALLPEAAAGPGSRRGGRARSRVRRRTAAAARRP